VSRFISERRRLSLGLALVAAVTACDLGTVTVAETIPQVVVHATLNTNAAEQVVLVEHTLTGTITVPDTGFNPFDPITTGGGSPISGAHVQIIDPAGRSYAGVEDASLSGSNGKGAGVYRVPLNGSNLVLGGQYRLRVETAAGDDVTATTRIPQPQIRSTGGLSRVLNRDHDTLDVRWTAAAGARTYAVRIESPYGPFFFFTDSTHFRVTGELRNPFSPDLERVLIPGFRQDVVVGAVDSNFYDYYRTGNDPFTGSGIINRISGGLGLFGSLVELNTGTLSVTADQTEPIEGRFRLAAGTGSSAYASIVTLYIESKAARSSLPDALSGRYSTPSPNARSDGIIGQQTGENITLAFLGSQLAGDTLELFDGFLSGDTLSGRYKIHGGNAVFVRSR
jgi:hypothetical protein